MINDESRNQILILFDVIFYFICPVNNPGYLRLIHSFLSDGFVKLKVNDFIGPKRSTGMHGLPQG